MKFFVYFCAVLLWLMSLAVNAQVETLDRSTYLDVTIPSPEVSAAGHGAYFSQLLELALSKTSEQFGPYQIRQSPKQFTSNRQLAELMKNSGAIRVIWTSNSPEREQLLLPIKVSILRGLNSYRIFLIRANDQQQFRDITTLQQLRQLRAGQGAQWPDTQVLQKNQLPVVSVAKSDLLFDMLVSNRFDYFPRGLYEVWGEQARVADKGIVIEESLMLHYPSPIYFFVNKNDQLLAARIHRGLELAIADGSFDKLFFSVDGFKRGYEELQRSQRRQFDLVAEYEDID